MVYNHIYGTGEKTVVDTISAFVAGQTATTTLTVADSAPDSLNAKITLFPDAVFTNQATLVSVILTDKDGNPANGKISLSCNLSGKWTSDSLEALTIDVTNGFLQTTFTAGSEVGSATIFLNTFNGVIATAALSIEKPSVKIQLSTSDTQIVAGKKLPLSVFVSDELLRPYANKTVLFTSSNGGQFVDGEDNVTSSANTNDSGVLSMFFVAPNATDTTTVISAYCEGVTASKTIEIR